MGWKPLTVDAVADWARLTNELAKADGTDEFYEADALAEELHEPGVDPRLDTIGVWADGVLAGFGQLRVGSGLFEGTARADIGGGVHPDFRGRGYGAEIMDRMEARARELAGQRHPGVPVLLRVSGGLDGASVRPMLRHRGYEILRFHHELTRPLPGVLPDEPAVAVRPFTAELSEAVRLAHNEAFAGHWGSIPIDAAHWRDMTGSRTFRPGCSSVFVDAAGEVQSYVMAAEWVPGEAWINLVGTRPSARGAGLARACLAASLRAMAEQGYATVSLGVDTQNATGAGALYATLGFQLAKVFATFGRTDASCSPARCDAQIGWSVC